MVDFFISRAGEDSALAQQINAILIAAGYRTFIQDQDFGSSDFTSKMDEGFRYVNAGAKILALHSRNYVNKPHCLKEARYPLTDDPDNLSEKLIVLKTDDLAPTGLFKGIIHFDISQQIHDPDALNEVMLSITKSLKEASHSAVKPTLPLKLNKVLFILETEDEEKPEKFFNALLTMIWGATGILIAFEILLAVWNRFFGSSFYPIFEATTVFPLAMLATLGVALLYDREVNRIANLILEQNLTVDELRALKKLVQERSWDCKTLIPLSAKRASKLSVSQSR